MKYSSGIVVVILTVVMLLFGTAFAKLYVGIHIVLLGIILALTRGTDDVTKHFRIMALSTLSLGVVLLWLVLWGSYHELPLKNEIHYGDILATAGFPFHTFNYPYPPMGGDEPPISTWPWFYANELFWLAAAAGVVALFKKQLFSKTILASSLFLAAPLISLVGLVYVLFKFD